MRPHRRFTGSGTILLLLAGAAAAGCRKETTPKLEVKSEATETVPGGKTVTKTNSTQIGSTLVKETETAESGSAGSGKSDVQTFVGTVVSYTAGRSIDVLTGENDHHRVDLAGKDLSVDADPGIAIGNKVRLVEERGSQGHRHVTISLAR